MIYLSGAEAGRVCRPWPVPLPREGAWLEAIAIRESSGLAPMRLARPAPRLFWPC